MHIFFHSELESTKNMQINLRKQLYGQCTKFKTRSHREQQIDTFKIKITHSSRLYIRSVQRVH
jgi:hypothetical protein